MGAVEFQRVSWLIVSSFGCFGSGDRTIVECACPETVYKRSMDGRAEYDEDLVVWSEHQAALLRRRAAGEVVNEAVVDWPNIAEKIESLGKAQSRELASRIAAVMLHLMKLQASPATEP